MLIEVASLKVPEFKQITAFVAALATVEDTLVPGEMVVVQLPFGVVDVSALTVLE